MSRTTASTRLRRLLAMIPWIAGRDGPTVAEICGRFGISRAQLLADLDVVFLVGLYPFTPDELIDVSITDNRVWLRLSGDAFAQPLRLTPEQSLSLVAAGASLLSTPGSDSEGPLARGLIKLAAQLGITEGEALSVTLGRASGPVLGDVRAALAAGVALRIDYYSYNRDERTSRVVEPWQVFADRGQWYLNAWCRLANAERTFRLDRIEAAVALEDAISKRPLDALGATYHPRSDDPRVVLALSPPARWVVEQYQIEAIEATEDGELHARLPVSGLAWFERLMVRIGSDARVVHIDGNLPADAAATAARRILRRYENRAVPEST